ncbi:hypothetical protein [Bordetella sp. LUAb4]|uniref:hypothetical protein n=1 Tax=Bordetella sp. LUAb4 TaxID=2843195 RepID=UPI001E2A42D3|nr:hypothetical protein [Bordetella sp. LUAb4]
MRTFLCAVFLLFCTVSHASEEGKKATVEIRVVEVRGYEEFNDLPLALIVAARESRMDYKDERKSAGLQTDVSYHSSDHILRTLDCPNAAVLSTQWKAEDSFAFGSHTMVCVFDQGDRATLVIQGYREELSVVRKILEFGRTDNGMLPRFYEKLMDLMAQRQWKVVETGAQGKGLVFE